MSQDAFQPHELTRLFKQYAVELYRLAAAIVWDRCEAEDIVQETFLRFHEATKNQFLQRGNGAAFAYLKSVARNLAIDRLRRRQTRTRYARAVETNAPEYERSPFEFSEERECERTFLQALGTLPDLQRAALILRVMEGASYEAIAQALGTDIDSVKTHLSRGRLKLRPLLAHYLERST